MYLFSVGEVAKDNGVPQLFVLRCGQLPAVGLPIVQPPVGRAKIKQDNLLVRTWTDGSIEFYIC